MTLSAAEKQKHYREYKKAEIGEAVVRENDACQEMAIEDEKYSSHPWAWEVTNGQVSCRTEHTEGYGRS